MQLVNQHLITKTDKITAITDLCGYQAQFYNNAMHSARIRTNTVIDNENWGIDLVKTWGHRGTMHIFHKGICIVLFANVNLLIKFVKAVVSIF